MKAARLHTARDIRVEDIAPPGSPTANQALIRVDAVGICGSDLHMYEDGKIGNIQAANPVILGHEFMGTILETGDGAKDGHFKPLEAGIRVAVEPAVPCWQCELCEHGHPNLCPNHYFIGLYPEDGALQERMIVPARNCFPMPDAISDAGGTLLETLGVAIHAVDLGHIRVGDDVAVIGCGPVGLLIIQLLKLAGVNRLFAFDLHDWRAEKAKALGATHVMTPENAGASSAPAGVEFVDFVHQETKGRGVDIAFEVAWSDHSVQLAADMARYGGRLVMVGIPGDDNMTFKHSVARRKGLSIIMSRRMKHTYPRAITLTESGKVQLDTLVSHTFPLKDTHAAFEKNLAYEDGILKGVICVQQ